MVEIDGRDIFPAVKTLDDVYEFIIADAAVQILSLNWGLLNIDQEEVIESISYACTDLLKNTQEDFSLVVLDVKDPELLLAVSQLPLNCKERIGESDFLVLKRMIKGEDAAFMRDWLFVTVPALIADSKGVSEARFELWFMDQLGDKENTSSSNFYIN